MGPKNQRPDWWNLYDSEIQVSERDGMFLAESPYLSFTDGERVDDPHEGPEDSDLHVDACRVSS